jgi:hypothetical protein
MTEPHVAVLVLNRNMREMTEALVAQIRCTNVPYTLYSLDADSDVDQVCRDADVHVRLSENRRWAWSFASGMAVAVSNELVPGVKSIGWTGVRGQSDWKPPTHFWLLCNDTQLDPRVDTLSLLLECMPEDACQIHPYQTTHPNGSAQGRHHFAAAAAQYVRDKGIPGPNPRVFHNVAFVEFVCPLITRRFYDQCLANFGCPPVNPEFAYGWGVDYEMAYFGHQLKMKSYICDGVGITHHPGTTHLNHEKTKVEDNNRMRVLARNNMLDVLEKNHGKNWGEKFANSARAAGVDPQAFLDWSSYDRELALRGARV